MNSEDLSSIGASIAKVKAVIWDLDDTLWDGALAENETIIPRSRILSLISRLDEKGIINSICSKNDFKTAMSRLQEYGVDEYFVFSRIKFAPKGENIRGIIDDLQLRAENVLFVDDNVGNREEAIYYNSSILVADPNDEKFVDLMNEIIDNTSGVSRLGHYQILENKSSASQKFTDNREFLNDSQICVNIVSNPEDLNFKRRIVELANRTNQLNFTKSRFPEEGDFESEFKTSEVGAGYHGVVFVHDRYGHYGLVGFFSITTSNELIHFFFSCRILNMGVEKAVYQYLRHEKRCSRLMELEVSNTDLPRIEFRHRIDQETKEFLESERNESEKSKTSVIAGCASGAIAHYLPSRLAPVRFDTLRLFKFTEIRGVDYIIFTVYSDYINRKWSKKWNHPWLIFSYTKFRVQLNRFLERHREIRIYLVTSSERFLPRGLEVVEEKSTVLILKKVKRFLKRRVKEFTHGSRRRYSKCNRIVRSVANEFENVSVVDVDEFIESSDEMIDERHFKRAVIKRMSQSLR